MPLAMQLWRARASRRERHELLQPFFGRKAASDFTIAFGVTLFLIA
jgi:hypothetical protein